MILTKALVLNSGPIASLTLSPQFENGRPKPIVLVGINGAGKTNLLSIIADGLLEIAASFYSNVLPTEGQQRKYFRVLGGRTQRSTAKFELSALRFSHAGSDLFYRAKSGIVSPAELAKQMEDFPAVAQWDEKLNVKDIAGPNDKIGDIFATGVYCYFPSFRYETPHWANVPALERDPDADFDQRFSDRLSMPIIVRSAIQAMKPWLFDVLLDHSVEPATILSAVNLQVLQFDTSAQLISSMNTYRNFNKVLAAIIKEPDARVVRLNRHHRQNRICVAIGREVIIPSLDALSAGQASLLAIFGTLVRYCDTSAPGRPLDQIEGIAIIDEIDAHLHADLQHDALPALLKLFPGIQFIITSHSPLFALGMAKRFRSDGFSLIDLPSGITIDSERFSEFEASFSLIKSTQAYESALQLKFRGATRPIVLCEGQTDPKYLKTAAELLSFDKLVAEVEFDWIGSPSDKGAQGGGKSHLNDALKFLKHNPQFQIRRTVLLYDPETGKPNEDFGNVSVRCLPREEGARRQSGVENLLPDRVFEARFFNNVIMGKGDDRGPVPVLDKAALCNFLCDEKRDSADFVKFQGPIEELAKLFDLPAAHQ